MEKTIGPLASYCKIWEIHGFSGNLNLLDLAVAEGWQCGFYRIDGNSMEFQDPKMEVLSLCQRVYWLVVWNMFNFPIYWVAHHPN